MSNERDYGPGMNHLGVIDYSLPPRGVSAGQPPNGLRNWDCRHDSHADPDNSGLCIHCGENLDDLENEKRAPGAE